MDLNVRGVTADEQGVNIMPRLSAPDRKSLREFEAVFAMIEQVMGFVPNSLLTMARKPELMQALTSMFGALFGPGGRVDSGLKQMIAHIASRSAGCQYCMAHTAHSAAREGVDVEKIEALWQYETSPLFSEAERAALMVAQGAAAVPNMVSDDDFARLRAHFTEDQIIEIIGVISLFGFLNRWNDTLATELEASPLSFSKDHLEKAGWRAGKHRS